MCAIGIHCHCRWDPWVTLARPSPSQVPEQQLSSSCDDDGPSPQRVACQAKSRKISVGVVVLSAVLCCSGDPSVRLFLLVPSVSVWRPGEKSTQRTAQKQAAVVACWALGGCPRRTTTSCPRTTTTQCGGCRHGGLRPARADRSGVLLHLPRLRPWEQQFFLLWQGHPMMAFSGGHDWAMKPTR